jgi:hypothetical protein
VILGARGIGIAKGDECLRLARVDQTFIKVSRWPNVTRQVETIQSSTNVETSVISRRDVLEFACSDERSAAVYAVCEDTRDFWRMENEAARRGHRTTKRALGKGTVCIARSGNRLHPNCPFRASVKSQIQVTNLGSHYVGAYDSYQSTTLASF